MGYLLVDGLCELFGRFRRNRCSGVDNLCRGVPAATVLRTFGFNLNLLASAGGYRRFGDVLDLNGIPSLRRSLIGPPLLHGWPQTAATLIDESVGRNFHFAGRSQEHPNHEEGNR